MSEVPPPPAVFLSYAWDSGAHQAWVRRLAERLRADGVDVAFDQWNPLGANLALFMQGAADASKRVLAVVSDEYVRKSDQPEGGVGFEWKVIAPTVMADLTGNRVVPILRENQHGALPRYLAGSLYADFRDDEQFERNYFTLLAELHGRPVLPEPHLGVSPFREGLTEAQVRAAVRANPSRYRSSGMHGRVRFDHSNNNGKYVIGTGTHQLTVQASGTGDGCVWIYNDSPDVVAVALVPGVRDPEHVGEALDHEATSRAQLVRVGDAAVLMNDHGFWAAVLVDEVLSREASETGKPVLAFRYVILPGKCSNFATAIGYDFGSDS
jgi:hypothetical protein